MRTQVALALVLLCGSVVVLGGVADASSSSTAPRYGSVTASSLAVGAEEEQQYLNKMQDLVEKFNVEPRDNAFVLTDGDKHWLVFTNQEPKTGEATVEGTIAVEATRNTRGAIFADSVSFNQDGQRADLGDVRDNPEQFNGELVKVTANYQQLAYVIDGSEAVTKRSTGGRLGGSTGPLLSPPGEAGRWAVRNLSTTDEPWQTAQRRAGESGGSVLTIAHQNLRWWIDAETTVDAVVLNVQGNAVLFVANTEVSSTELDSISEISNRGGELEGEVVTVESQTIGTRISSQELLLSTAKCAPESVVFPPTGCIPVPADVTVHAGVLFERTPDSSADVVVYAGVSNHHQQKVLTDERGTYRVTGRVVSTEQIDPDLPDGYALVVYDMQRTGGLQASQEAEQAAQVYADGSEEEMRGQINQSGSETNADSTSGSSTATPTSTPQPARLTITSTELAATEIETGDSVAVSVTVGNTGEQRGEMELVLRMDGEVVAQNVVRVGGGRSETVHLGVKPESEGAYELSVSGESVGTLQVVNPDQSEPLLSEDQEFMVTASGLFIGFVLFVSSFAVELLRGIKEWRGHEVNTSSKPGLYLLVGFACSFIISGYTAGAEGRLVLMLGISTLALLGFTYSLKVVYDSL